MTGSELANSSYPGLGASSDGATINPRAIPLCPRAREPAAIASISSQYSVQITPILSSAATVPGRLRRFRPEPPNKHLSY
jgi:hypothetical protein